MQLEVLDGLLAICKLPSDAPDPIWAIGPGLCSITRTTDELSVVCRKDHVPIGLNCERDWRGLRVRGTMSFSRVGVLASLTTSLADAGVGRIVISTDDTDYVLVRESDLDRACVTLIRAGHLIDRVPNRVPMPGVRLRPIQLADLPQMFEWQQDLEGNRLAVTYPRSREVFDAHWSQALLDPHVTARAILQDEQFVGYISCYPSDGTALVGYWIDRPHWGQGIATQALKLFCEELVRRPLFAITAGTNQASMRVLQKCGFVVDHVRQDPGGDRHPACEVVVHVLN